MVLRLARESLGHERHPARTAAAGSAVVKRDQRRHITCLLSDRYLSGGGVEVEFFGERTLLPAGPATLALRTGAPLLPYAVYFRGDGIHGVVRPPVRPSGRAACVTTSRASHR